MQCPQCQKAVDSGAVFCGNCGFALMATPQPSAVPGQFQPTYQPASQSAEATHQPAAPVVPLVVNEGPVETQTPVNSNYPEPLQAPFASQATAQLGFPSAPQSQLGTYDSAYQPPNPSLTGLPTQPMVPGYGPPVQAQDHSGKAIACLVLGALALPGSLIPIIGVTFAILAIVFGTMSIHSARKVLAIVGMSLAVVALLASIFLWIHNTQWLVAVGKTGVSTNSSANGGVSQTISTPCYTTKVPASMKITQTADSCTFLATSIDKGEQIQVKVLQIPQLTLANLSTAAKADAANVVGAIPGGSIVTQRSSTFAESQAYDVVIKATDGSAGTISYVYDTTAQGDLVIVLHTQARASGNNFDLSAIEADWEWL